MPTNCGIEALSQLTELKNISAFTLVHAARDNGLNLFVFKVNDLADLVKVQRPAIFHQEDHFVYIKNGEPLPKGKYTGFALGNVPFGRVIGLQEAKFIKGGKNFLTGKNKDGVKEGGGALGTILSVVGAVVGAVLIPGLGAGIGATMGGAIGGGIGGAAGNAITGDNPLIGAATGAVGGGGIGQVVGGLTKGAALAGSSALASNVPAAGSGAAHAAAASLPGTTFSSVPAAAGLGGASSAFNAINSANAGASTLASSAGVNNSIVTNAGQGFNANGSAVGAFNPSSGVSNNFTFSPTQLSSITGTNPSGVNSSTAVTPPNNPAGGSGILNSIGKTAGDAFNSNPIGAAATLAGGVGLLGSKAPAYTGATPGQNYSTLNTFLGSTPQGKAANTFGLAATNANTDIVNTSIPDLQKSFTANNQRTLDTINTAYDNQKQALVHSYAQAGQNLANSSELQNHVQQLEQKRTNDLTLAQQELQDQALGHAISVKQTALSQGMQAGQFNQTMAMQLASLTGDQQNLQYAIANNDYQSFQQIMGKLLTMGIPQNVNIINNGQKSSVSTQPQGV